MLKYLYIFSLLFFVTNSSANNKENIINELKPQSSQRLLVIGEALRLGVSKKMIKKILMKSWEI